MSNTTQKTEQELANESFDKRMKKEAYKGAKNTAFAIRNLFGKAIMKYSSNSLKAGYELYKQVLGRNSSEYNMFEIGVMLNLCRGVAFEMLGCDNENELLATFELLDTEYKKFNEVAQQCWKAAEKEAASKIKVAKK